MPWNGLTGVEDTTAREAKSSYLDGIKYLDYHILSEFSGKLKAFTYPDEFDDINGTRNNGDGVLVHDQPPKSFGLSYRTKIGNDVDGVDHGYSIHILWNLLALPDPIAYASMNNAVSPIEFAWGLTSTPKLVPGYRPTAHLSIKSTDLDPRSLAALEAALYGTDETEAYLPSPEEVIGLVHEALRTEWEWLGPTSIPDTDPGYLDITFDLPSVLALEEINFHITHPYASDLAITVIPPDGNRHQVMYRVGGSLDNFGTGTAVDQRVRLRDDAEDRICDVSSAEAVAPGLFKPCKYWGSESDELFPSETLIGELGYQDAPLSDFGPQLAGTWRIRIKDYSGGDAGEIQALSIIVLQGAVTITPTIDENFNSAPVGVDWVTGGDVTYDGDAIFAGSDSFLTKKHTKFLFNRSLVAEIGDRIAQSLLLAVELNADSYVDYHGKLSLGVYNGSDGLIMYAISEKFYDGGLSSPTVEQPYDPVAHRWWRIDYNGEEASFYTSPDRETWTLFVSLSSYGVPYESPNTQVVLYNYNPGTARAGSLFLGRLVALTAPTPLTLTVIDNGDGTWSASGTAVHEGAFGEFFIEGAEGSFPAPGVFIIEET